MAKITLRKISQHLQDGENRLPDIVRGIQKLMDQCQDLVVDRLQVEVVIRDQGAAIAEAADTRRLSDIDAHIAQLQKARQRSAELETRIGDLKELARLQLSEIGDAVNSALAMAPVLKVLHDLRLSEEGEPILKKIVDRTPRIDWSAV